MNALEKLKLSKELRGLLGGMDGLKAMEKLKAAKRVRELVALLGGESQSNAESDDDSTSQPDQDKEIASYFSVNYQSRKGERRQKFVEEMRPQLDAIIRGLELIKAGKIQELNDFEEGKIKPSKVIGSGYVNPRAVAQSWLKEQVANAEAILQTAIQLRDGQNRTSNPLYQSVIDGAEITVALLDQIIKEAEANGDADDPQLAQAVEVIEQWATERGWERAVLDSLFAAVFGGVQGAA